LRRPPDSNGRFSDLQLQSLIMSATVRESILHQALDGQVKLVGLTVDQYHDLIDRGTLAEDTSTELIDGLLVQKDRSKAGENPMTVGDRHRIAVLRLQRLLPQFEAFGCFLQAQQPITLPPDNEPEPDISVIRGTIDDYAQRKPAAADIISVLEVADSSLNRDLSTKLRVYAAAGIAEYIVVDLQNDIVIVHRQPQAETYTKIENLFRGDVLQLSAGGTNHVDIAVSVLL
jgi:Uma2 family endonuclease